MLVTPINYMLCSVNVALFGSSAWHLGRKVTELWRRAGSVSVFVCQSLSFAPSLPPMLPLVHSPRKGANVPSMTHAADR